MLDLKTVQTVHYVKKGLYAPEVVNSYIDFGEAISSAVRLKEQFPNDLIYVESTTYTAVLSV